MTNIIGNQEWIKEWKNREDTKSEDQKEKDRKLYEAVCGKKSDEMEKLLNEGATPDYVTEGGWTAYYWTLYRAKFWNDKGATKILTKFYQKWKNQIEKSWSIWMAVEYYSGAATIINWSGKTEIVTNSKHPIIAILKMMRSHLKEEYSRKIMKDLNLKTTLQTDLNSMLENNINESDEFKENFSNLSKLLKEFNFEVAYEKSSKTFKTNFDQKSGQNSSLAVPLLAHRPNPRPRTVVPTYPRLEDLTLDRFSTQQPNVENDRIFQKSTKYEERKVIEQFQNSRNISHHIPQYQIKVKLLYFF